MPPTTDARVRDVQTFLVRGGISDWLLVKLTTESGVTGIGDATLEGQSRAVLTVVEDLRDTHVIGRSVFDAAGFVRTVLDATFWRGGPVLMSAIGGLEIAMWDAAGKLAEKPVHRLLGSPCRASVRAYANGWYRSIDRPEQFADEARAVVEDGYTGLKLDPLGKTRGEFTTEGFRNAVAIVAAIRETVGEGVDILLDLHGRLSPHAARNYVRATEPLRPYWVEEPVAPEAFDHLPAIYEGSETRIALGERFYTSSACAQFLRHGRADVIQPDLGHAGGLLEGAKTASIAEAHGASIAPHTGTSPVITAASLHLDATIPNALIQETFDEYDHPTMRSELFSGLPRLVNGKLPIPQGPGLGVDFNEEACAEYPARTAGERSTGVLLAEDWPRTCWAED